MKICGRCQLPKRSGEFIRRKAVKSGLGTWCKNCAMDYAKERYAENPKEMRLKTKAYRDARPGYANDYQRKRRKNFPDKVKDAQLRHKYGISIEDWKSMFSKQKGACAICKTKNVCLCVDHNHTTGEVRALLCVQCNYAIAHLKDSSALARAAATYLDNHTISRYCAGIKNQKQKE